ncbi:DUF421 domain-containing protein [Cytobacillus dafuensis]|uniref:DUF421 domain-containing protein n=1 Tax=Cytobacillus dafuensis TaxID=1742359 RepID=A0A5B8ZAX4_CYTDA|nr:DUF421 domain-containing protein [Cytobacillus dafuensis]QED50084.1 DUF421 domain-containing protein [Cytobacillus dafuensis]
MSFVFIIMKLIIGLICLYFILIVTGRKSFSQLTPLHFIFILLLDDFLGHVIYENDVSIFKFLFAIGFWTLLILTLDFITLKYTKIRILLHGNPVIIIRNGIIDRNAVKKSKLDLNQILSLLRQKSVFSVREVEYALLEPNGQISISLKSKYKPPSIEDFNLPERKVNLPLTLIMDGNILQNNLKECGMDEKWLLDELCAKGFDNTKSIFYAEWKEIDGLHISPK